MIRVLYGTWGDEGVRSYVNLNSLYSYYKVQRSTLLHICERIRKILLHICDTHDRRGFGETVDFHPIVVSYEFDNRVIGTGVVADTFIELLKISALV